MIPETVLKVGGSLQHGALQHGALQHGAGLTALCREISRLAERCRLLVVPGGGIFADQVRNIYRQYSLNETAAHRMALLAMDQYGYLLNQLITGSSLISGLTFADRAAHSGRAEILLPAALVNQDDALPHSWNVTSDSIAAWIAHRVQCNRLILLKDVDGLLTVTDPPRLISELTVQQLAEHNGGVDKYLFNILCVSNLETWVINGLKPERLSELLATSSTIGTRIRA